MPQVGQATGGAALPGPQPAMGTVTIEAAELEAMEEAEDHFDDDPDEQDESPAEATQ